MSNLLLYVSLVFSVSHYIWYYKRQRNLKHIYFFWMFSFYMFIVLPLIVSDVFLGEQIINNTKIAISIPMIILPFGITVFDGIFKSKKYIFTNDKPSKREIKIMKIIVLFSVIISLIIVLNSGAKPILYAIRNAGDFSGLVSSREEARGSVISIPYIEFWLRQIIFPLIIVYYFAMFERKRCLKSFFIFILFLIYGSFFGFFNLVKSPFVVIMLSIILYKHLTIARLKKIVKPVIAFLTVISGVMIGFLRLFSPDRSVGSILGALWKRVFYTPAYLTNSYIEIFSDDKLIGQSMPLLYLILGEKRFNLSNYVYNINNPETVYNTGTAPASFVGEGFANFGFGTVVFYSILLSFLLALTFKIFTERKKTPMMVSLYAVIHYSFYELIRTSFFTGLTSYGVILLLAIALYSGKMNTDSNIESSGDKKVNL